MSKLEAALRDQLAWAAGSFTEHKAIPAAARTEQDRVMVRQLEQMVGRLRHALTARYGA